MSKVLVYAGPGTSHGSRVATCTTLTRLFRHQYDVQEVDAATLARDPWEDVTKLVVLPGGRDMPYVAELERTFPRAGDGTPADPVPPGSPACTAAARIRRFVEQGGAFLGICAGAYYASSWCQFATGTELEVEGPRTGLRFYPDVCWGPVFSDFDYGSESGARQVRVAVVDGNTTCLFYHNGGGAFLRAEQHASEGVRVVAHYETHPQMRTPHGDTNQLAAAVSCRVGAGNALLFAVHPEMPLGASLQDAATAADETHREQCFAALLANELHLPASVALSSSAGAAAQQPPRLTPIFLASEDNTALTTLEQELVQKAQPAHDTPPSAVERAAASLSPVVRLIGSVQDSQDSFLVLAAVASAEAAGALAKLVQASKENAPDPALPKPLVFLRSARHSPHLTPAMPLFAVKAYFDGLDASRAAWGAQAPSWAPVAALRTPLRIASVLGYAQVTSSTQTLLEKNAALLTHAPPGTTLLATHQVAGRGRGPNTWLSPQGCLQFSTLLRLPTAAGSKAVFIQYLAALAIVYGLSRAPAPIADAVRGRLKIKWPNDVYAEVQDAGAHTAARTGTVTRTLNGVTRTYAKLAGILVNAVYRDDAFHVIVGCGVNCTNERPTTSVSELVRQHAGADVAVSLEVCAAAIHAALENLLNAFAAHAYDFTQFASAYRGAWLNADQEVRLDEGAGEAPVRVVGITSDYGLLRTVPLGSALQAADARAWGPTDSVESVDLQPDGNSFDMLQNLVRRK